MLCHHPPGTEPARPRLGASVLTTTCSTSAGSGDRAEIDPTTPRRRRSLAHASRQRDGQAALPASPWPGQRQQPRVPEQIAQLRPCRVAADQGGELGGQVADDGPARVGEARSRLGLHQADPAIRGASRGRAHRLHLTSRWRAPGHAPPVQQRSIRVLAHRDLRASQRNHQHQSTAGVGSRLAAPPNRLTDCRAWPTSSDNASVGARTRASSRARAATSRTSARQRAARRLRPLADGPRAIVELGCLGRPRAARRPGVHGRRRRAPVSPPPPFIGVEPHMFRPFLAQRDGPLRGRHRGRRRWPSARGRGGRRRRARRGGLRPAAGGHRPARGA